MDSVKEMVIRSLKKLISFLEERWDKSSPENTSHPNSPAPKILTEEKDLNTVRPYLLSLKQSIDTEGINNIALTDNYGSGKSSILKTFQDQNPWYEYLNGFI